MAATYKNAAWSVLLVLLSVFVVLAAAETLLAVFHPVKYRKPVGEVSDDGWRKSIHRPSEVPGLAFELSPNIDMVAHNVHVTTNSHGMRDAEPMPKETGNLVRITAIGDSFTFGFGVRTEEAWPYVLERLLNKPPKDPGRTCDVLNFGVGGYSARDEALVFHHKALPWNPRVTVLGYFLNDPETEPLQPLHTYFQKPAWWQHVNLGRLVASTKKNWDVARHGEKNYFRYLHAPGRPPWQSVLTAFGDISQTADEHGIEVLLVIFPYRPLSRDPNHYLNRIYEQVAQAGREAGFRTLKLSETFSGRDWNALRLSPENNHLNAKGNRLAAEAIAAELLGHGDVYFKTGNAE